MADILQDFPVKATQAQVFEVVSTPSGLDRWWTKRSAGEPVEGSEYQLWFGPQFDWRARVTRSVPGVEFELEMIVADNDWLRTRVGFRLETREAATWVQFRHTGWPAANEHYRVSTHCWALYLRVLRRYLEVKESVPYEARLGA